MRNLREKTTTTKNEQIFFNTNCDGKRHREIIRMITTGILSEIMCVKPDLGIAFWFAAKNS